jgi:hypothetical protein
MQITDIFDPLVLPSHKMVSFSYHLDLLSHKMLDIIFQCSFKGLIINFVTQREERVGLSWCYIRAQGLEYKSVTQEMEGL